jgi:REP element-mobilizing transposase RayT
MQAASMRCRCAVHAYVLMTNHVHLLLTPARKDAIPHARPGPVTVDGPKRNKRNQTWTLSDRLNLIAIFALTPFPLPPFGYSSRATP